MIRDRLQELRWLNDRGTVEEARRDLAAWIAIWAAHRDGRLVEGVAETIDETPIVYKLPRRHHKHLESTNMLERLNEEIQRRAYLVPIFCNAASCCRLIGARAVETHENWLEAHRSIDMDELKDHKKAQLRQAA